MNKLKWLYPGIGIKRWLLLIIAGIFMISTGIAIITDLHFGLFLEKLIFEIATLITGSRPYILKIIIGIIISIIGIIFILWSLAKIEKKINKECNTSEDLVDVLYEKRLLGKGPNIVALGGGTGLSTLLRGLKKYTSNLTAIVTVADDGGSSGKLRNEMGVLPPGDIRNCLIALADIEPLMQKLMQYRFKNEGDLKGHSFGNLFIASMNEVVEGGFEEAIKESSKVLAIKGQILPVTNENIQLGAIYEDGSVKMGESRIPVINKKIEKVFLEPSYCKPTEESLKAIAKADIITLGPGSLYTSILPNLLINHITDAIRESKAIKVYICNVMTQPGETDGYSASDHVKAIYKHVQNNLIDYIILNREKGSSKLRKKYKEEGAYSVEIDYQELEKMGLKIIEGNLLSENEFMRHNPLKTAELIIDLFNNR